MIFYHGTDLASAEAIKRASTLNGDRGVFGPGVCTNVSRALNYSAIKCAKHGPKARSKGRILVIELDESVLVNSSMDAENAHTINDINGRPLRSIPVRVVEILTIPKAQKLIRNNAG